MADEPILSVEFDAEIQVRSATKREIEVRLLPWDVTVETMQGPEEFARGSFANVAADQLYLMGLEHAAGIGLGQDGRPVVVRNPAGRSKAVWEADDGPHATFGVARTQAGDEILALAEDRIIRGVSIEFREVAGGTEIVNRNGRRVRRHTRVAPSGASLTYRPAYGDGSTVLAVRSQGVTPVAEIEEPAKEATVTADNSDVLARVDAGMEKMAEKFLDRLERNEERFRSQFILPAATTEKANVPKGQWMEAALRILSGERIADSQMRAVADVITSDNAGIVPDAYSAEMIGVIDPRRPFMSTTTRIPTPASGMSLVVPVLTQRPTVATQTTEKSELSSEHTIITTKSFDMITKGGVGDISLQLLKRADRSFLDLYLRLLAEAYAIEADEAAVQSLITAAGGWSHHSDLDPNNLSLGDAFSNSFDAVRRPPDTMWISTLGLAGLIDAKDSGTNRPLYSNITANVTAGGGAGGSLSGLRVVHTPALDAHGATAIVGPSSGFAWAEDGTYTLQVDVPSKAGRDVALVGMLWFAPWYPDAFTVYRMAS